MTVALAAAAIAILTASGYLLLLVDTLGHGRFPHPRQRTALAAMAVVCAACASLRDARPDLLPAPVAGVVALVPILVGLAIATSKRGRVRLADIGQRTLVGAQTFRVVGFAWIVFAAAGYLPAALAIPLGVVELAVGVLAPTVSRLPRSSARRFPAIVAWNGAGLFASVAAFAFVRIENPFPLDALVLFVEPVAIALHVLSIASLVHRRTVAYLRGA